MNTETESRQLDEPRTSLRSEGEDDGVLIPGSAPPLSPGRTDVNPDDQAGVEELPGNGLDSPRDATDDIPIEREAPDIDVDQAERDDTPNPR